jgi:hypothetical protein
MLSRRTFLAAALVSSATAAHAQVRRDTATFAGDQPAAAPSPDAQDSSGGIKWRTPLSVPRGAQAPAAGPTQLAPITPTTPRQPIAKVTRGTGTLPNDAGQEWRDYDITPYTTRVTSTARPEQAVLDWILRETGYEAWHTRPLALLSVDSRRVSVYHTPQMHAVVQEVVDRFVNTEAESHVFGMRVITLRSPDWRAKHHRLLHPIAAQTQGIQAWLLAKEDYALMVADLRRRSDFQEHSTPHLMVNNGQSKQISANATRNYIRDVNFKPGGWPGFEPQMAQFDEGFKLEFSPLLSLDGRVVDAVLRCEIDQIEKLVPVTIDVSTTVARQHQRIEVPQSVSSRLHERFRWPADQVLLLSLGMGPTPVPTPQGGLNLPLISNTTRAELLIFVESRGRLGGQPTALQPPGRDARSYQNRYKIPAPPAAARTR